MNATAAAMKERLVAVQDRIVQNQTGASGRFLLFRHDPTGLGAQISRRALAVRIGLMTGRTAVFPEEDFYPYDNAFEPLASVAAAAIADAPPMNLELFEMDSRDVVSFDFWSFWENEPLKRRVYGYVPVEFERAEDPARLLEGAIFGTFQLNSAYAARIAPYLGQMEQLAPVVGVHFRRGDKYVETPYVSSETYRANVIEVARRVGAHNVFISSDSPEAVKELALPSSFNVVFDTTEKRYNNANHKFLMKNPEFAAEETFTAIKNIYMLARASKVVGQTNAHFASLAAGLILARGETLDYGSLVAPSLVPKSSSARLLYAAYRGLRSLGKRLLPAKTLRYARRRA